MLHGARTLLSTGLSFSFALCTLADIKHLRASSGDPVNVRLFKYHYFKGKMKNSNERFIIREQERRDYIKKEDYVLSREHLKNK